MADSDVPIFRGGSGSDCEEFIRSIYAYALREGRANQNTWIANYVASRLSGKALRWYARLDPAVKTDWEALQIALLDQYPPSDDEDAVEPNARIRFPPAGIDTSAPSTSNSIFEGINQYKRARIRVEDGAGTIKGWISTWLMTVRDQWPTEYEDEEALQVQAERVDARNTTMRILNGDGKPQLCISWSTPLFDPNNIRQSGELETSDEAGLTSNNLFWMPNFSPVRGWTQSWEVSGAGAITFTRRVYGADIPLRAILRVRSRNRLEFFTAQAPHLQLTDGRGDCEVNLFYEPIE